MIRSPGQRPVKRGRGAIDIGGIDIEGIGLIFVDGLGITSGNNGSVINVGNRDVNRNRVAQGSLVSYLDDKAVRPIEVGTGRVSDRRRSSGPGNIGGTIGCRTQKTPCVLTSGSGITIGRDDGWSRPCRGTPLLGHRNRNGITLGYDRWIVATYDYGGGIGTGLEATIAHFIGKGLGRGAGGSSIVSERTIGIESKGTVCRVARDKGA